MSKEERPQGAGQSVPTFTVECEDGQELLRETVTDDVGAMTVRQLRSDILQLFQRGSPLLEVEPETDEDQAWVLVGIDRETGTPQVLTDPERVLELTNWTSFRVTPSTRNAGRRA